MGKRYYFPLPLPLSIRLAAEILLLQLTSGGFIVFNDPHQVVVFSSGIFAMAF